MLRPFLCLYSPKCVEGLFSEVQHSIGPTPSGILMPGAMLMRRARPRLASLLLGEEASTYFYVEALVVFLSKDT